MKEIKIILLMFIIFIDSIVAAGCWNYREVDELSIVAGVAIDKGVDNQFQMTAEVIEISTGKELNVTPKIITAEGKTMFDVARNMIALSGKRLYWAHTKVIILSQKVASEGMIKAIEWYNRDAETREDVKILISQEESAKEIFNSQKNSKEIQSFKLDKMINNQVSLSKAPITDIMKYDIESKIKEVSTVVPAIKLKETYGKIEPQIIGSAIVKNDKLVGFLNGEETKDLIFIRNQVKGGVLVEQIEKKGEFGAVSFEIFNSKTKVNPVIDSNNIAINLDINTTVAIDEIYGICNFSEDKERIKLEQSAEKSLKQRIELLIGKVQSEYDADIFCFGSKLMEDKPKVWKSIKSKWDEIFKNLNVNVQTKVHIKNSAILSKSSKEGD